MKNMINKGLAIALAAIVLVSGLVSVSFAEENANVSVDDARSVSMIYTVPIKTVEVSGTYKVTKGWVMTTDNMIGASSDEVSVGYIYLEAGQEFYSHNSVLELVSTEDLGMTGYVELLIETLVSFSDFT